MRKLSVWGMLCMVCTACFCAPSLRASSIPLNHQPSFIAPKTSVSATGVQTDSEPSAPAITTTDTTTTNDTRISFNSPIKNPNRYYVPTAVTTGTGTGGTGGGNAGTTTEIAADIAAIQRQIDELVTQQQQMADTVKTTVQNEINDKIAPVNEAITELQDNTASIADLNATVDSKVSDTLIDKGIVDNRGKLLVATTDDIQPLALTQKLESTLATKFAKKTDVEPTKLANEIITNDTAVQTLSSRVGTNENSVKSLIANDLKQRGIINSNNVLNVATKDELPVINTETVAEALQNSPEFDNMISQNLVNKGIYDSNKQLQILKKTELTPELLQTKLGDTYAKPSDITTEKLSAKLGNTFITPDALRDRNYATRSELPVISEATVSAALANSNTLDNTVIANLKRKNILDSNENLNVATKDETTPEAIASRIAASTTAKQTLSGKIGTDTNAVKSLIANDLKQRGIIDSNNTLKVATKDELPTAELQQQITNLQTAQTRLAQNQLTRDDITSAVQDMELTTTNNDLQNALSSIRSSNQNLQTSVASIQRKTDNITNNLGANIDSKLRERGLTDNNNTALFATKNELKSTDDIKNIITADLINKEILNTDGSLNIEKKGEVQVTEATVTNALRNSNNFKQMVSDEVATKGYVTATDLNKRGFITNDTLNDKNYATKDDTDPVAIADKIANSDSAKAKLSGKLGTDATTVNNLITQQLKDKGLITNDTNATRNVLTAKDITKELLTDTLDDTFVTATDLNKRGFITNDALNSKNYATKDDTDPVTIADKIAKSDSAKAKLSGQLGTSETDVKNILVRKGLLNDDENNTLKVATIENLSTLSGKVTNLENTAAKAITTDNIADNLPDTVVKTKDLSNLVINDLKYRDILKSDGSLNVEIPKLDEATVSDVLSKSKTLDNMIDDAVSSKGYLTNNDITNLATKTELSGYAKNTDLNSLSGRFTTLLNGDENTTGSIANKLKAANVITDSNFDAKITAKNLATKNDLPKIDDETVNAALAKSKTLGDMIDTAVSNKGYLTSSDIGNLATKTELSGYAKNADLFDSYNRLKVELPENVITTGNMGTKLSGFAKTTDLTADKLGATLDSRYASAGALSKANLVSTLGDSFAKPADLSGFLTDTDLTAERLSKKLGTTYLKDSDLTQSKLSGKLSGLYASADSVSKKNLINTLDGSFTKTDDVNNLIVSDLKSRGILSNDSAATLQLLKPTDLSTELAKTANKQAISTALGDTFAAKGTFDTLSGRVTTLLDGDENTTGSMANKLKNAGFAKNTDLNSLSGQFTTLLNGDENTTGSIANKLKAANVITDSNFDAKITAKNLATKNDLPKIDDETVNAALAKSKTLGDMIDTAVSNKGYLTSSDIGNLATKTELSGYAKNADLFDSYNRLKVELPENVITTGNMGTKLSGFAKTTDLTADKLGATLDSRYASAGALSKANLVSTLGDSFAKPADLSGFLTDTDLTAKKLSEKLGDTYLKDSDLTQSKLSGKLSGLYASADSVSKTNLISTLGDSFAKPADLSGFLTDTDLTAERLSKKLGTTYLKDSDLTQSKLSGKLSGLYASADSVSKTNLISALGDSFAKPSDLTADKLGATLDSRYTAAGALTKANLVSTLGDAFITDSDLTATKLANKLGNTYTKQSDVNSLITSGLTDRGIISVKDGTETLNVLTPATLGGELTKNNVVTDSALTTKLGNYATTNSLSALSTRTASLESNALTADNLPTKLSANNSTVKRALADAGFAQTNDIATTVNNTLNGSGEGSFSARLANAGVITNSNLNDAGIITTGNIASNTSVKNALANATNNSLKDLGLVNIDAETGAVTSNAITTKNIAAQVSNNLPSTVVRTTNGKIDASALPTTVVTTGNIADTLNTSDVKSALETAGFAKTDTVTALASRTSSLETTAAKAITTDNIAAQVSNNLPSTVVRTTNGKIDASALPTTVVTTGNIANTLNTSDVKSALSSAGFAKTDDVVTKNNLTATITNAGFAKASDVVSTANFATQLQSSLNNTNVKNALTSAGFATKDDTSSQVVTMKDLSQLLSGGLVVDSAGNVKLDSSANNTNANAISSKLTAAKQKDSSIGTAKIRAESNIAASVANIAVTAATANAAANENIDLDQEKCNQTDYMFWNTYAEEGKGMCEKCPDESVFSNPKGTTPSSRCKCDDPARKVAYDEGENRYMCVDAGDENACLAEPDTYWNGTKCNKCPEGTYFNDESMDNSSLPRCVCEDKSATFNTSTGRCVAAGQSECANNKMVWSPKDQACVECPKNAPFNENAQECVCEDTNLNFDKTQMACIYCEPGSMFSASEGQCIDANKETCATNNHYFWHINDEKCYICPEFAPYNATAGGCACKDEGLYFDTKSGECIDYCPDGAHYESSRHTCVCDDAKLSIYPEEFTCR